MLYAEERCIVAITEAVAKAHAAANLSQADVAKRLRKTKAHVSRLLGGERNMTLRSLADLLWVCDLEVTDLRLATLGVSIVPSNMQLFDEKPGRIVKIVAKTTGAQLRAPLVNEQQQVAGVV